MERRYGIEIKIRFHITHGDVEAERQVVWTQKATETSSALFTAIYGIMLCVCQRWSIGYERFSVGARLFCYSTLRNESLVMILIRTYSSENAMYDIFGGLV